MYLVPVDCELAVTDTVSSDTVTLDAVVESITHPTWPSTGGFSLYRVFRLHGVCTHTHTNTPVHVNRRLAGLHQSHHSVCR